MKTFKFMLVLSLVLLAATSAFAQDQTGSIIGTLKTEDGAVIVGARVTAASAVLIRPITVRTNARGTYIFHALPVGTYTLTFEAENYQGVKLEDVSVALGGSLKVSPTLKTGVVGEEIITITGEAPLIDVKSNETGMSISKDLFNVLPKGRNYTSLVILAPGAKSEELTGGIEIDGASKAENVWYVNGVDVSDIYGGESTANVLFDFVEEVQVRSGGYDAEFGGSMGGVVNVITRSGGNEFHGEGTMYYEGDALNGDRREDLRISPTTGDAEYVQWDKDEYSRYEMGGGLGGYLIKDRIWFFGSYLPTFRDTTRNVKWRDSNDEITSTEPFDQEFRAHNASVKVSAQLTDALRVTGSYSTDWQQTKGSLPSRTGQDNPDFTWDEQGDTYPGWNVAANVDYMLSDQLYFNFKGGYHQTDHQQVGGPGGSRHRHYGNTRGMFAFEDDPAFASIPEEYRWTYATNSYGYDAGFVTAKDLHKKQNWSGDITSFNEMAGSHMFKGGVQYFKIGQDVDQTYKYDYVLLRWDQASPYHQFSGDVARGTYGYYEIRTAHPGGYGTVADISSNRYALFLQDSWGLSDRLTVNAGIRTEKENIPSFSDLPEFQDNPVEFGFGDKIAPRIGAAYDVFGDGKFKLFGNYAMYYDVMKMEMAEGSYGGFKWQTRYFTLDTLEWWTIGGEVQKGPWPKGNMSPYPGIELDHRDWRIPSFESTDPELLPTAIWEMIFGGDYQLADNMALNVRFVHKRLIRTIEDVGVLTPDGELYYTANPGFGYSVTKLAEGAPPTPKAKRHYYALEMRLNKRFSNNWQGGANLTLSNLTGNYSGLSSSDEQGRNSPNVERYFDSWLLNWDSDWNPIDGEMPTDRRYVLKLFGSYTFDFGLTLGLYHSFADGTPHQTDFTMISLDGLYPNNRGDLGRSDMIMDTDVYAEYNFSFGEYRAQVNMNVTNLFDMDTAYRIYHFYNINNPYPDEDELIDMYNSGTPFDWQSYVGPDDVDPRFGKKYHFMGSRSIRLGFKFIF